MNRTQLFLKKHSATCLTIIGSAGVIITTVLAVKATPKALKMIEEAENDKGEELTKLEVLQTAWTPYIPAVISCVSTIACIFGSNYINIKRQKSMAAAYMILDNAFREYRNKVIEQYGKDVDTDIRHQIIREQGSKYEESADDSTLFFEFNSMRFFESSIHKVMQAECKVLAQLEKYGQVTLNDYYSYLGIDPSAYGEAMGWSKFQMETEQYVKKLEFTYDKVVMTNGLICWNIVTNVEPTMDHFCF